MHLEATTTLVSVPGRSHYEPDVMVVDLWQNWRLSQLLPRRESLNRDRTGEIEK